MTSNNPFIGNSEVAQAARIWDRLLRQNEWVRAQDVLTERLGDHSEKAERLTAEKATKKAKAALRELLLARGMDFREKRDQADGRSVWVAYPAGHTAPLADMRAEFNIVGIRVRTYDPTLHSYLLAHPLDISQEEVMPCTAEQAGELSLRVQNTLLFRQSIMQYGAALEVLGNNPIREAIVSQLREACTRYGT